MFYTGTTSTISFSLYWQYRQLEACFKSNKVTFGNTVTTGNKVTLGNTVTTGNKVNTCNKVTKINKKLNSNTSIHLYARTMVLTASKF